METKREELIKTFSVLCYELDKCYAEYAKTKNLTHSSLYILGYLFENQKPLTQKEIADIFGIHKQVVNMSIKYFLENNYIELKGAKEDRREKLITLTDLGKDFAQSVFGPLAEVENNIWNGVTDGEITLINGIMKKYSESIKTICIK